MLHDLQHEFAGTYVVERMLGRGGMASVWLARDLRHGRLVALKVLHPELAGAIGVDRFAREVQVTARLQHPGLVPVLESGVIALGDGTRLPWYTMPYIAGETLRHRLDRERQLAVAVAVRITEEVAAVLSAAHRQGVVHRDIKPENIILADDAVYVVDFGVAKALADTGAERLTSTGVTIGTTAYMSPEQSSSGGVDARSDQYSLACLLYEMLTGEPPFTGATAQAIVVRRFAEPARPIRSVRPAVPVTVERTVLRALERVPADRFDSVSDFAIALRAIEPFEERQPSRRTALIAVALMLLATVGVGGWIISRPRQNAKSASRDPEATALLERGQRAMSLRTPSGAIEAVTAFNAAIKRDSGLADAWGLLATEYAFASLNQFNMPGLSRDSLLRLAVAAVNRAVALDSNNPGVWVTRATVSRAIDPTDMRDPIKFARRALKLDPSKGDARLNLAVSLEQAGELDSALAIYRDLVKAVPSTPLPAAILALSHYRKRQYDSAAFWADSSLALDPTYLLGRTASGYIAIERGDYAKSVSAFEAARRLSSGVEIINALAGRALAEARLGDRAKARATLQVVDSMAKPYLPPEANTAVSIAQAYAALGDRDRAIQWLEHVGRNNLYFQLRVRCNPPFDPLRSDRRFQAIVTGGPNPPGIGC
jgi:serine/threonine protein kinase/Tfp pilus assembly protein PilF